MKQEIMILNVCRYKDKNDESKKTSFNYVLTNDEAIANNDNYKGYSVLTLFVNKDVLAELTPLIMRPCVLHCDFISSTKNPLRPRVNLKSITDVKSNKTIDLA